MGPFRLAKKLNISKQAAKKLLARFWATFPKIKEMLDKLVKHAKTNGYAYSPLDGRRLYMLQTDWAVSGEASHASNQAKNLPFQGGNATITKIALTNIRLRLKEKGYQAKLINVVHDEILLEVHKDDVAEVKSMVEHEMIQAAYRLLTRVPMKAEAKVAECWQH